MNDRQKPPKSIKFVYKNSDDYKVVYINGIHGGITMNGEVFFDLFLEHRLTTKSETHTMQENGSLGPRIKVELELETESSEEQPVLIRERKIGVVLSRDTAYSIAEWLRSKVKLFDEVVEKKVAEEQENAEE